MSATKWSLLILALALAAVAVAQLLPGEDDPPKPVPSDPGVDRSASAGPVPGPRIGPTVARLRDRGTRPRRPREREREFLRDCQQDDGSWAAEGDDRSRPAVTGLAVLAFIDAGESHRDGEYRETVRSGLRWLERNQGPDGCFGPIADADYADNHAIATFAMCATYANTHALLFRRSAEAGIECLASGGVEGIWELMTLRVSERAGLSVPGTWRRDAKRWLDSVTDAETGVSAWPAGRGFPATVRSQTAAAALGRIFALREDPRRSTAIQAAARYLVETRPEPEDLFRDPVLMYFGSQFLFQVGGDRWNVWVDEILRGLSRDREAPDPSASPERLGRPGIIALTLLTRHLYLCGHNGRIYHGRNR